MNNVVGARRAEPDFVHYVDENNMKNRRSVRLKGYDYSQEGYYFITIDVNGKRSLFGHIIDGAMLLNECGRIVAEEWVKTVIIRDEVMLDEWVVMPDHFHAISRIVNKGTARIDSKGTARIDLKDMERIDSKGTARRAR